jgi:uncharacterized protein (TIGR02996 family)
MISPVSNEQHLLNAVIANPDADGPRLAYADWLDTSDTGARDSDGKSQRANLIRVQCRIAKDQKTERSLLDSFEAEWSKPIMALGAEYCNFHRGFPEHFALRSPNFEDHFEKIAKITPIWHFVLHNGENHHLKQLAESPAIQHTRILEVGNLNPDYTSFDRNGLQYLLDSPNLQSLTSFTVKSRKLGIEGAMRIADAAWAKQLTNLRIVDPALNPNEPDFITHLDLALHPNLRQVQHLQVGKDCQMGPLALKVVRDYEDRNQENTR